MYCPCFLQGYIPNSHKIIFPFLLFCLFLFFGPDLVESASLFRIAAGVYHHLAQEVLPSLQINFPSELPPEATTFVADAMSLICLAEAQVSSAATSFWPCVLDPLALLLYLCFEVKEAIYDVLMHLTGSNCKEG